MTREIQYYSDENVKKEKGWTVFILLFIFVPSYPPARKILQRAE